MIIENLAKKTADDAIQVVAQNSDKDFTIMDWYSMRVGYESHFAFYIVGKIINRCGEIILGEYGSQERADSIMQEMRKAWEKHKDYKMPEE